MPRKLTVECTCDRCGRIWYEDYVEGEDLPELSVLNVRLTGPRLPDGTSIREVTFDALCKQCFQTVIGYIDKMGQLKHRSPTKTGDTKEAPDEGAPPSEEKVVKRRGRPSSSGSSRARST
jgi:hypothetical protein